MFSNIVRNIKWALLIAIVAGPGFAWYSFDKANKIEKVMSSGLEAEAFVDGGTARSGRRSGTSYTLHTIWADAKGAEHAEDISISSKFAEQVVVDDTLMVDVVHVKYLPDVAGAPTVIVEDAAEQIASNRFMVWLGIGAGVVGLIGSAGFFLFGRRKKDDAAAA